LALNKCIIHTEASKNLGKHVEFAGTDGDVASYGEGFSRTCTAGAVDGRETIGAGGWGLL